jgi:hypothetical protein
MIRADSIWIGHCEVTLKPFGSRFAGRSLRSLNLKKTAMTIAIELPDQPEVIALIAEPDA